MCPSQVWQLRTDIGGLHNQVDVMQQFMSHAKIINYILHPTQVWQLRTDIGSLRNQVDVMQQQKAELEARAAAHTAANTSLQVCIVGLWGELASCGVIIQ